MSDTDQKFYLEVDHDELKALVLAGAFTMSPEGDGTAALLHFIFIATRMGDKKLEALLDKMMTLHEEMRRAGLCPDGSGKEWTGMADFKARI